MEVSHRRKLSAVLPYHPPRKKLSPSKSHTLNRDELHSHLISSQEENHLPSSSKDNSPPSGEEDWCEMEDKAQFLSKTASGRYMTRRRALSEIEMRRDVYLNQARNEIHGKR